MRKRRILPATLTEHDVIIVQRSLWGIAFGSASITSPSNSTLSSLATQPLSAQFIRSARYQPKRANGIGAVLFDAMGTLVRLSPPTPALVRELHERHAIRVSPRAAHRAMRAEIAHYLAHHDEGVDARSLAGLRLRCARIVGDELGGAAAELTDEQLLDVLLASLRFSPYRDAAPTLRALRERGLALAVVSNWDAALPEVLERVGLGELVDVVVTSAQVGAGKPDARPLQAALAAVGVAPEHALHVGDSVAHDIGAARAAGVRAVLLARRRALDRSDQALHGVTVIGSLSRLRALTDATITA